MIYTTLNKNRNVTWIVLFICCVTSLIFVWNNHRFYDDPIAKVVEKSIVEDSDVEDAYGNKDHISTQDLKAVVKNGPKKGETITLQNTYSTSQAYDQEYQVGDELFVSIDAKGKSTIQDLKRDKYLLVSFWLFLFILYGVGKRQGLLAVVSLGVNILLMVLAIEIYVHWNVNLIMLAAILAILFTTFSLLLVNGWNEKTYAAILATILGTLASIAITLLAMRVTSENGLRYEEMQFLTRPYKMIFIAGLFIGSLGAVMDVAITMSSSVFELWEKNIEISMKSLKQSGMAIGKDIMGTMTSILFFAYISGSIPMLILFMKNASPLGYTLSLNLSLELVRALAGGIGIVLTIPIGLYISMFFVKRKKAKL